MLRLNSGVEVRLTVAGIDTADFVALEKLLERAMLPDVELRLVLPDVLCFGGTGLSKGPDSSLRLF